MFCSLLYVQACRQLADLLEAIQRPTEAAQWRSEGRRLEAAIRETFWDGQIGLFRAATIQCRQPDVWGSAFAVYLAVATPEQARTIAKYFKEHYGEIVQRGQIRHLPGGVYWEAAGPKDAYQNGGYWATATGWFVNTLDLVDPKLADQTVIDMVNDFRERGISEWIFGSHLAVMNYLASATMPLAGVRRMLARRGTPFPTLKVSAEEPNGPDNLAYVGNGAKPATASSEYPDPKHKAIGVNDGRYGNTSCWIANRSPASFQIELAAPATIGCFKFGRDRTGQYHDRAVEHLQIEVSLDGRQWQDVFDNPHLSSVKNYAPSSTVDIEVPAVRAMFVKVTVAPKTPNMPAAGVDEFEIYAPDPGLPKTLPAIKMEPSW